MIGLAALGGHEAVKQGSRPGPGRHVGGQVLSIAEANGEVNLLSNEMTMRPLTGSIGAEILDLDLREIDDARFVDIRRAFLDHCMLVFRDLRLAASDLLAFTRRWGDVFITPPASPVEVFLK